MKVTYQAASLTSGWVDGVTPGEDTNGNGTIEDRSGEEVKTVEVNANTANYVYKDGSNGKLVGVNADDVVNYKGTLGKVLQNFVTDEDTGKEGGYKKGQSALDTEGYSDEMKEDQAGSGGGKAAGACIAVAVGIAAPICVGVIDGLGKALGASSHAGDGFTQAVLGGIINAVMSGVLMIIAYTFDGQLDAREAATNKAESNDAILEEYSTNCCNNIAAMTEHQEEYTDLTGETMLTQSELLQTQSEEDSKNMIMEIQGLGEKEAEAEAKDMQSKGTEKQKSNEQLNMDILKESLNDAEAEKEEMAESISEYDSYNSESQGAHDMGDQIAKFLQVGNDLSGPAKTCGVMSTVMAAFDGVTAAGIMPKSIIDVSGNAIAKALWAVAGGLAGMAASKFFSTSSTEESAGSAGDTMAQKVGDLQSSVNDASSEYTTTEQNVETNDALEEETMAKAQEQQDEKLSKEKEKLKKEAEKAKKEAAKSGNSDDTKGSSKTNSKNANKSSKNNNTKTNNKNNKNNNTVANNNGKKTNNNVNNKNNNKKSNNNNNNKNNTPAAGFGAAPANNQQTAVGFGAVASNKAKGNNQQSGGFGAVATNNAKSNGGFGGFGGVGNNNAANNNGGTKTANAPANNEAVKAANASANNNNNNNNQRVANAPQGGNEQDDKFDKKLFKRFFDGASATVDETDGGAGSGDAGSGAGAGGAGANA